MRETFCIHIVALALAASMVWCETMLSQPVAYEGYGYATTGGEGGDVYHVTTLEDGGPGSLRAGVFERAGPRKIVFDVAGTITITNLFKINSPFLTIDGATAPAPGITLTKNVDATEFVISGTHDIILRYLRFQGLYLRGADTGDQNTGFIVIDGDWDPDYYAHHIVVDHLTILNATDSALDIWGEVSDVTVSWCVIANNFHPSTVSFIPDPGQPFQKRRRISMHHNAWVRNNERNPQIRADVSDFDYVNNIVYDWGYWEGKGYGIRIRNEPGEPQVNANLVNNYFVAGLDSPGGGLIYGSNAGPDPTDGGPASTPLQGTVITNSAMGKLWVAGNLLPPENLDHYSTIPAPNPVPTNAQVTTYHALELKHRVVPDVGTKYRTAEEEAFLSDMISVMEPKLRVLQITPAMFVLEFKAPEGSTNQLQFSDGLPAITWEFLTNFIGDGTSIRITNAPASASTRFYRVVSTEP